MKEGHPRLCFRWRRPPAKADATRALAAVQPVIKPVGGLQRHGQSQAFLMERASSSCWVKLQSSSVSKYRRGSVLPSRILGAWPHPLWQSLPLHRTRQARMQFSLRPFRQRMKPCRTKVPVALQAGQRHPASLDKNTSISASVLKNTCIGAGYESATPLQYPKPRGSIQQEGD